MVPAQGSTTSRQGVNYFPEKIFLSSIYAGSGTWKISVLSVPLVLLDALTAHAGAGGHANIKREEKKNPKPPRKKRPAKDTK